MGMKDIQTFLSIQFSHHFIKTGLYTDNYIGMKDNKLCR